MQKYYRLAYPEYLLRNLKKINADDICIKHIYPLFTIHAFKKFRREELNVLVSSTLIHLREKKIISSEEEKTLQGFEEKWVEVLCSSNILSEKRRPYGLDKNGKLIKTHLPIRVVPLKE